MMIARQSLFGMPNKRDITALSRFAALTLMAGGFAAPATAIIVLPPATFTGSIAYGPTSYANLSGPGTISHTDVQSAAASAVTLPQTRVEVTGSSGPLFDWVYATARIQYSFFIFSTIDTYADVIVDAEAGASASGRGVYATEAYVALVGGNNTRILEAAHACGNSSDCFGTTPVASRSWNLGLFTNQLYTFDLYVYALSRSPGTVFDVWADPTVIFDPAYAKPAGANLRINTGLTAIATIPEPESWALLIVGFGGVGAMARRRRMVCVAA